ncbi:interleukin-17F-like [Python bivittatus]|uniref:Interleukin-17F-like n=1 Tax=Python bivittatus TaxID=176946 RepID=A0A9F5IZM8_PYTBI|nr:interleukin-17F-like [Python bivittatus]
MTPKRLPFQIRLLLLMLAVGNLAHGGNTYKTKKKRSERMTDYNCPTQPGIQEDAKFPETVKVHIHVAHTEPIRRMPHDVRNRSLSPWDYSVKEDPNRFPHLISEASCRHTVCLDSTGNSLNYAMNSVPIQQEILVLKRKHVGCKQTYWLEKQVVTVGCTCAFPASTAYQKKIL